MGVEVISTDMIKPTLIIRAAGGGATEKLDDDAFKLCFIDQFMIRTYFGIIIFYPPPPPATDNNNNNNNNKDVVKQLKATLSIALNTFYPLSGRVKENLTVDDFQAGVPFTETRVKGYNSLADFLKSPNMEFLNHFSPVETFALTTSPLKHPLFSLPDNQFLQSLHTLLTILTAGIVKPAPRGAPLSSTHDNDNDNEMGHLVQLIRTGVASIDDNYIDFISSSTEEAFQVMVDGVEKFRDLGSQLLTTSSWIRFCFSDADFGFGKPVWTSVLGEATANYPIYNDLVILTELLPHPSNSNNTTTATTAAARGIEAWVRLDVEVMKLLEQNSNFLQFASLNPPILF
ncbi:(13S,14R)-1,13-dihydroxy-N-methylcanadine 13-O-acetyltransferase AT1 [Linum grandiflorum]